MCVHFRFAGDGSAMLAGLSGCIVGRPGCGCVTCGCLSSLEDGVEAAGVVFGWLTSCSGCDAASGSAAALRGCLTSFVGAAGAVLAAASDLGRDVTCGCLSSLEDGVEAAGVVVGWMGVTCGCLSSLEDGVEAAGVVAGLLTSFVGAAGAVSAAASDLGRDLTSIVGAAGAVAAAASDLGRDLTCGCLSSLEDGVEAAGGRAPEMASAGMAVQYGSLLPKMLMMDALNSS